MKGGVVQINGKRVWLKPDIEYFTCMVDNFLLSWAFERCIPFVKEEWYAKGVHESCALRKLTECLQSAWRCGDWRSSSSVSILVGTIFFLITVGYMAPHVSLIFVGTKYCS